METRSSRPMGPGVILGLLGGLALVIGSFLTWATVSLDIAKFAQLLGVDATALQGAVSGTSTSVTGTKVDGKITLALGVLVVVGVVLVFTLQESKKVGYAIVAVAGLIGAGICVYEVVTKSNQIDNALSSAGPALAQVGITVNDLKPVVDVTWGIGLWICMAGGAVALIGGVIGLISKSAPVVQGAPMGVATAMDSPVNTGFNAPPPPVVPPPPAVPNVAPPSTDVTPPTIATRPPTEPTPPVQGGGTGTDQPTG